MRQFNVYVWLDLIREYKFEISVFFYFLAPNLNIPPLKHSDSCLCSTAPQPHGEGENKYVLCLGTRGVLCSFYAHIHTHRHPFSASIHPIHSLNVRYFLRSFPLFHFPPPLIALLVSLPSDSSPFMPSSSYHSDWIFISALFWLWSPVPLCLLPAVFVQSCSCTERIRL